jgi:hypothetical protein
VGAVLFKRCALPSHGQYAGRKEVVVGGIVVEEEKQAEEGPVWQKKC